MFFRCVLLLGPLLVLSVDGFGGEPRSGRVAVRHLAAPTNRVCIGVLGAVARPGSYEFHRPDVDLVELIDEAGGLADDATGNIRIVRGGRPGQQVFLRPGLAFPLLPNDVVIAVGQYRRPTVAPRGERATAAEPLPPVQLAMVNVLKRPVVLKVRGEHANVVRLVELLGQPAEVCHAVRIIPTMGLTGIDGPLNERSPLPASTVLVFEGDLLDEESIPPLPPAFPAGASHVSGTDDGSVVTANRQMMERAGPVGMSPSGVANAPLLVLPNLAEGDATSLALADPGIESEAAAMPVSGPAPRGLAPRSRGRAATEMLPPSPTGGPKPGVETLAPPSGDAGAPALSRTPGHNEPLIERSVVGYSEPIHGGDVSRPFPEPGSTPVPGGTAGLFASGDRRVSTVPPEASARAAQALAAMGSTEGPHTADAPMFGVVGPASKIGATLVGNTPDEEPESEIAAAGASLSALGLVGTIALVAGGYAVRRRRARRAASGAAASLTLPARADSTAAARPSVGAIAAVDDLIANRLPIDVELARLPSGIEVFGRARARRRQRIDLPHAAAPDAPHFLRSAAASERTEAAPTAAAAVGEEIPNGVEGSVPSPAAAAGRRFDEPHDERSTASATRPHLTERKGDLLERALAAVEGHRGTGGPHIPLTPSTVEASIEANQT